MWNKINKNSDLANLTKGDYKKLFFAAADQFSRYVPNEKAVNEKVMPYVLNLAVSQLEYQVELSELKNAIASNDTDKIKGILNYLGFNNLNEQEQEKVMAGIKRDSGNKYVLSNLSEFPVAALENLFSITTIEKTKIFDNVKKGEWTYKRAIKESFDTVDLEKEFFLKLMEHNGDLVGNQGRWMPFFKNCCPNLDFLDNRYSLISTAIISSIERMPYWEFDENDNFQAIHIFGGLPGVDPLYKYIKDNKGNIIPNDTIESPLETFTRIHQLTPNELEEATIYNWHFFDTIFEILAKHINNAVGIPTFVDSRDARNIFNSEHDLSDLDSPTFLSDPLGKEVTLVLPNWVTFQIVGKPDKTWWSQSRNHLLADWKNQKFVGISDVTASSNPARIPGAVNSPIMTTDPYDSFRPMEIDLGKKIGYDKLIGHKIYNWPSGTAYITVKSDKILGKIAPFSNCFIAQALAGKYNLYEITNRR